MTTRRGAAQGVTAALFLFGTLVGCGAPEGKGAATKPTGQAVPGGDAPAGASVAATFPMPPDIKIIFSTPAPPDETKARITSDFQYIYQGYYYSLHTAGKDRRFLQRLQFDALTAFSKAFDYSMENRMTVVGTLRFFNTRVLANSGDRGGAVETCVDESQLRKRSRRTGKTVPTIKTKRDRFYKVISGMRRGDDGVWRMSEFLTYNLPDSRAKECQQ